LKKLLKGFTLMELIIVMAILVIIMGGLMQFFTPIRSAYYEATSVDTKRNTCNSMTKYVTENLRYAQFVGVYSSKESVNSRTTPGGVTIEGVGTIGTNQQGAQKAAQQLLNEIYKDSSLSLREDQIDYLAPRIRVIMLDYTAQSASAQPIFNSDFNNNTYSGRLWRFEFDKTLSTGDYNPTNTANRPGTLALPSFYHMAFGRAYYGANDFGLTVKYDNGIMTVNTATKSVNDDNPLDIDNPFISTSGAVNPQNISEGAAGGKIYYYTDNANGDTGSLVVGSSDEISDILQYGTLASGVNTISGSADGQYFFAYISAADLSGV
jgi:prepilin-type N-terminal cleavage/methylation domain-containing protein